MPDFMDTFVAILNAEGKEEVPGVRNLDLFASVVEDGAKRYLSPINDENFYKLARLQTLAIRESEKGEIPEYVPGHTSLEALPNHLIISRDANERIAMLRRTITEIVRKIFPTEEEQFDVTYHVGLDRRVFALPTREIRHFD